DSSSRSCILLCPCYHAALGVYGTHLCKYTVYVLHHSFPICGLVLLLYIRQDGTQVCVPLKPEESMEVQRAALVRLYGAKILADASKHRVLPDSHIIFEEHRDLPMEEEGRAKRIGDREPDPLIYLIETSQESFGFVR